LCGFVVAIALRFSRLAIGVVISGVSAIARGRLVATLAVLTCRLFIASVLHIA
jgi:hypothetical protein